MGTSEAKTMTQLADEDREFGAAWGRLYDAASSVLPFSERMAILRAMATKIAQANDRINWRPIEEGLPPPRTTVLLAAELGDTPFIDDGYYDEDDGWQWSYSMPPTHWAPLNLPGDCEGGK